MKRLHKISVCIITFNEQSNIRRCLESVRWCDEIVVLDSYSTDDTISICKEYTQAVYQNSWEGYIVQRNRIRELATTPWVLFLDADEECSRSMQEEIENELSCEKPDYVGYSFPRQVYYLGQWIKHGEWYPDLKLRLFLKELGTSAGVEPHDTVIVDGPVKTLKGQIWHYTYKDITDHIDQLNRFSGISAKAKFDAGKKFRWIDIFFRPALRFLKSYVFKLGVLDGFRGLMIAIFSSVGVFLKYAKLWDLDREHKERQVDHSMD